ncbi:MaoC family dehydratase [Clostridium botulinum]|uniref:MaoC family dehydratase n=1 Tax=Clostridium botulinum TaxID=1491 RepID=UPI0019677E75|nr:MaoC family dehydratase [Clostridium botulinum]MBN1064029.1 enoyl-CoA hydratase [Clostridium botulinum]
MKININDMAYVNKEISEYDIDMFAKITGDYNKIHFNKEYSDKLIFKDRVAHGMLTASLISTVLGTKLPGEGCILLSINSKFIKPVYIGDKIKAIVRVKEIIYDSNKVIFETFCKNQQDCLVMTGEAVVKYRVK